MLALSSPPLKRLLMIAAVPVVLIVVGIVLLLHAATNAQNHPRYPVDPKWAGSAAISRPANQGIHKIKHVIFIMQENRSFDHFFGTFPGADGIPMSNGRPSVCVPNPAIDGCTRPFH